MSVESAKTMNKLSGSQQRQKPKEMAASMTFVRLARSTCEAASAWISLCFFRACFRYGI